MFRNHKYNINLSLKGVPVTTQCLVSDGNDNFLVVSRPVNEINSSIPDPEDYQLEDLLLAGVPLQPAHASLDESPSVENIENFVNNNLKLDENEN